MNCKELYRILDEKIPASLSCEWDKDGLECCPDIEKDIKKVLVSLDVTDEVIDYAAEHGFDAIVAHHPLFFKGLRDIS